MAQESDDDFEFEPTSKDKVLARYIDMAKSYKKRVTTKAASKRGPQTRSMTSKGSVGSSGSGGIEEQMMLTVGRMHYDHNKAKAFVDKEFGTKRVFIHKHASWHMFVTRCCKEVFPAARKDAEYFVADGSGVAVSTGEELVVQGADGTEEKLCWNLENYLQASRIRFPSKARFYCVQKLPESADEENTVDAREEESGLDDGAMKPQELGDKAVHPQPKFEPLFTKVTQSTYGDHTYSFITDLCQEKCLAAWQQSDLELRDQMAEASEGDKPVERVLYPENPCDFGMDFVGIRICDKMVINLVKVMDYDKGLVYTSPEEGAKCLLWTGGFAADGVGLMACVATEGFHSLVRYQWHRNGNELQGEVHPIIYAQLPGDYSCVVFGEGVHETRAFTATGEPYNIQGIQCPESDVGPCDVHTDLPKQYIEEVASVADEYIEGSDEVHMLNVIGQGSYGTVYRGIWRGTIVAAKVIAAPSSCRTDAMREIEMCRSVQHPNILNLMGTVVKESSIILITNLVRGCDLHSLIFDEVHEKLSFTSKLYIAVQVCQATAFLHTSKPPTVHMDIKPANILVEQPSLHVYLADFGLAKMLTSGSYYVGSKTMKAGTPGFQAPEQLRGEKVDEKCDVYAFGCVLIELFGEHPVWPGLGAYQIMFQISKNNVPSCDGLPNGIEYLCRACLSETEKRPNMIDILKSLIHLHSGHK